MKPPQQGSLASILSGGSGGDRQAALHTKSTQAFVGFGLRPKQGPKKPCSASLGYIWECRDSETALTLLQTNGLGRTELGSRGSLTSCYGAFASGSG